MRDTIVSVGNAFVGRLTLGFVQAVTDYPLVMFSLFALTLMLVVALFVQTVELRLEAARWSAKVYSERPVRLRR